MRWISSMKSTSLASSEVRIAAMSFRSRSGPATWRIPTPSSLRTICASEVFPRPGGPASRTWSSASPRRFAASRAISSCSFTRSCPTKSSSERGRSERSSSSSASAWTGARNWVTDQTFGRSSRRPPQRLAHLLLDGQRLVDVGERPVGVEQRPTQLDKRVARRRVDGSAGGVVDDAELLLQLQHDALRRLAADPRDRLEPRRVLSRDRARELAGWRTADDRERDLRADAVHAQEELEQLALGAGREPVELERVLAHVRIDLDGDLAVSEPVHGRRRLHEVADAAHVDDKPAPRAAVDPSAQPGDQLTYLRSGGASAWQIATASASAAWFGRGRSSSARIVFTIRCTCCFSARP